MRLGEPGIPGRPVPKHPSREGGKTHRCDYGQRSFFRISLSAPSLPGMMVGHDGRRTCPGRCGRTLPGANSLQISTLKGGVTSNPGNESSAPGHGTTVLSRDADTAGRMGSGVPRLDTTPARGPDARCRVARPDPQGVAARLRRPRRRPRRGLRRRRPRRRLRHPGGRDRRCGDACGEARPTPLM